MVRKKVVKKRVVKKAKRKGQAILPDTLSGLIGVALKDMKKAEKDKRYVIDMADWYNPNAVVVCTTDNDAIVSKHTVCSVCAAGSVMVFSLGGGPKNNDAAYLNGPNGNKLRAINSLREGHVGQAAVELGIDVRDDLTFVPIPDYDALNPKPFHKAMGDLQQKLKKAGL